MRRSESGGSDPSAFFLQPLDHRCGTTRPCAKSARESARSDRFTRALPVSSPDVLSTVIVAVRHVRSGREPTEARVFGGGRWARPRQRWVLVLKRNAARCEHRARAPQSVVRANAAYATSRPRRADARACGFAPRRHACESPLSSASVLQTAARMVHPRSDNMALRAREPRAARHASPCPPAHRPVTPARTGAIRLPTHAWLQSAHSLPAHATAIASACRAGLTETARRFGPGRQIRTSPIPIILSST